MQDKKKYQSKHRYKSVFEIFGNLEFFRKIHENQNESRKIEKWWPQN